MMWLTTCHQPNVFNITGFARSFGMMLRLVGSVCVLTIMAHGLNSAFRLSGSSLRPARHIDQQPVRML
jgi:hypothetical protein